MTGTPSELAAQISDAVVHYLHERLGRGPGAARTIFADSMVVVWLQETLSEAEFYLVATGKAQTVGSARRALRLALRRDLASLVEDATGQRVTAVLGDQNVEVDLTVYVFLLDSANGSIPAGHAEDRVVRLERKRGGLAGAPAHGPSARSAGDAPAATGAADRSESTVARARRAAAPDAAARG